MTRRREAGTGRTISMEKTPASVCLQSPWIGRPGKQVSMLAEKWRTLDD